MKLINLAGGSGNYSSQNPRGRTWFEFKSKGEKEYEISIHDEIGGWGIAASTLCKEIRAIPANSKITVGINSPGGSVFDGIAIYNTLHRRKDVVCRVDGIAASIASVILMAGKKRIAPRGATVMIHDPSGMAIGKAKDMDKTAEALRLAKDNLVSIYARHTELSEETIGEMMDEETWMSADEAQEQGFLDEVTEAFSAKANSFDLSAYRHPPDGGNQPVAQAGAQPSPVENNSKETKTMDALLNTLAETSLIAKGVKDEAEATSQFQKNWSGIQAKLDTIQNLLDEVERLTKERDKADLSVAETLIDSAIADGRLGKDQRESWVRIALTTGSAIKAALEGLPKPKLGDDPPIPPERGSTDSILDQYNALPAGAERAKFRKENEKAIVAALSA